MERKAIGIQGISTGSNYEDGACLEMMNMRHEQGVLKPVESFPVDFTLKHVYDLLYWHKNNDYAHLIGVRNNGIYWIQNPGAENETEGTPLLTVTSTVTISHIGNIINVIDGETLKYIFWKDSTYFIIDMDFDGEQSDTVLGPVKIDIKIDGAVGSTGKRKTWNYYQEWGTEAHTDQEYIDAAKGLINKSNSYISKYGLLSGYLIACYAIELYDGSFIKQSNPIFLGQAFDLNSRYDFTLDTINYNYISNQVMYDVANDAMSSNTDKEYITERETLKIIDSTNLTSNYNEVIVRDSIGTIDGNSYSGVMATKSANILKIKIGNTIDAKYESIVKSICIFISPQIYGADYDNLNLKRSSSLGRLATLVPKPKSDSDIVKEIQSNQRFYKVKEIAFDEIVAGDWIDLTEDLKGKLGDNLLNQQELVMDSFSNIKAKNQMIYNSMLHAWDIKNVASRGWPLNYFIPSNGAGQFQPTIYDASSTPDPLWYIEVLIKTDTGVSKVVRYSYLSSPFSDLQSILSYPDSKATQMTIYQFLSTPSQQPPFYLLIRKATKLVFKLTASKTQNFAYYIAPDLKPISFSPSVVTARETVPAESNQQLSYQNKLKVSNTNNPFLFPDGQTYQIGDGTILNVASQSIRTSDGQFGEYPLVCFCNDGVFTLQVGDGTVAYSKVGTPQNYERPISKVICVTPYGIAFISNRGLCMVVGQDIEYLSESMFEKFRTITLELPEQIEDLFALDLSSFNDYLKTCTAMVYNPKEQEIIMINPAKAYNYVYNMSTKQFYRNVEAITNEINNSLPDMQVWTGETVKKVTVVAAGTRNISFVTRPIKMQTPDMKRFERVIMRAYLSGISGTPSTACIWGSLDDRNFKLLRGMVLENSTTRKDIDFGMFGKTTYRSYIIGISMTVGTDSEIEAIEMQVEKEFKDTKMR